MLRVLPVILLVVLVLWAAVDAVQTPASEVRHLPKTTWVVLILLFPVIGSAVWLLAGRPRPLVRPGGPGGPQDRRGPYRGPQDWPGPSRGPRGPDDDPDFLHGL